MEKRELIEYGFVSFTGKVWKDCQVDAYNYTQGRINQAIEEGYKPSEELLISSHKLYVMFSYHNL